MIALLIAMVGLMGTVAVQQTMLNATANSTDAAIATRLAAQSMEELSSRVLSGGPPVVDQLAGAVTVGWSKPIYLSVAGERSDTKSPAFRFQREIQVANTGVSSPYNISVRVTYNLDGGEVKTIRIDQERRKTW
jgi:hypothetical protein